MKRKEQKLKMKEERKKHIIIIILPVGSGEE